MIVVLALRRADARAVIEGSRIDECEKCGEDVLVAPETDEFLKHTPALIRCTQCAGIHYELQE